MTAYVMCSAVKCDKRVDGTVEVKIFELGQKPILIYRAISGDFYIDKREGLLRCANCNQLVLTRGEWK